MFGLRSVRKFPKGRNILIIWYYVDSLALRLRYFEVLTGFFVLHGHKVVGVVCVCSSGRIVEKSFILYFPLFWFSSCCHKYGSIAILF